MSWWALFDRLVPVAAVGAAGTVGYCLGRANERINWLTGRRTSAAARRG